MRIEDQDEIDVMCGDDVWFRAELRVKAFSLSLSKEPSIEFKCFAVARSTPKGVWLKDGSGGEFFVLGRARKQYALPTTKLAIIDLVSRKRRHLSYRQAHLRAAQQELLMAENAMREEQDRPSWVVE
jgi:hypothetical protein